MSKPPYVRRASLLDPDRMIPADRCAEIASILATGFLRLRRADVENKELDVPPTLSDSCLKPLSIGERHE